MPDFSLFNGKTNDLEFIRDKVKSGDWITVQGAIDAVNDTIEYQPATGKTFYLYSAKIVLNVIPTMSVTYNANNVKMIKAALKIDTVVEDTTIIGVRSAGGAISATSGALAAAGFGTPGDGRFDVSGLSLEGNSSKVVEIENVEDGGSADALLMGWIEDT